MQHSPVQRRRHETAPDDDVAKGAAAAATHCARSPSEVREQACLSQVEGASSLRTRAVHKAAACAVDAQEVSLLGRHLKVNIRGCVLASWVSLMLSIIYKEKSSHTQTHRIQDPAALPPSTLALLRPPAISICHHEVQSVTNPSMKPAQRSFL